MVDAARITGVLVLMAWPAWAQLSPAAKMNQVAANQLGLLEYCQAHGQASGSAVAAEREAMSGAPSTALSTVEAEAAGRQGYSVGPDGARIPVAGMAASANTDVAGLCRDLAASALSFEAALHGPGLH